MEDAIATVLRILVHSIRLQLNWSTRLIRSHTTIDCIVISSGFMTFYVSFSFNIPYSVSPFHDFNTQNEYAHTCVWLLKNYPWNCAAAITKMMMVATVVEVAAAMNNHPKKTAHIHPFFISHSITISSTLIQPILQKRLIWCLVSFLFVECIRAAFGNHSNVYTVQCTVLMPLIFQQRSISVNVAMTIWYFWTSSFSYSEHIFYMNLVRFVAAAAAVVHLITAYKCHSEAEKSVLWKKSFAAG